MRDVYIGPLSKESFRVHAVRALLDWCEGLHPVRCRFRR